jgi:RHS repeat-associated protein
MGKVTKYRVDQLRDGSKTFTTTDPNGLKTITTDATNGTATSTAPSGMTMPTEQKPDPRYGMQSPLGNLTVKTPAGLQSNANQFRKITQMSGTQVTGLTDSVLVNGKVFKTQWDGNQRMLTKTSAEGRKTFTFYDSKGRVIKDSTSGLVPTTYIYDSKGRRIEARQDGRITGFEYDTLGRQSRTIDPYGRSTYSYYDGADRLIKTVGPDRSEVLYNYDRNGNVTSITPPGKPEHTFDYSLIDLEMLYTPPFAGDSGRSTSKAYDLDKQIVEIARPDSLNMKFYYGGAGSLIGKPKRIVSDLGQTTVLYDTLKGLVLGVISPNGDSLLYQYDGQIPRNVRWSGSVVGNIKVRYDYNMRVLSETVNQTDSVNFIYDRDALLTSAGVLRLRSSGINNLLLSDTLGNVVTNYIYDAFGELAAQQVSLGLTTLYRASYVRDSLGRVIERNETIQDDSVKHSYAYDAKSRLTQVMKNNTIVSTYIYDANGNRIALITPTDTAQGNYHAQDGLLNYGSTSYVYSANGDLRMKIEGVDTTRFVHDALGDLLSVTLPGGNQLGYIYDGGGRRVVRKVNEQVTNRWLYSDELRISAELDSIGRVLSHFVYATKQNVPDYVLRGGVAYRVITDQIGSVRAVVNSLTGEVIQRMDYDEFGNVIKFVGRQIVPMGFAGGLYDLETDLVRFGARDYDASVGRWITKDPLRFGSNSYNQYCYSFNDPVNTIDIGGLSPKLIPPIMPLTLKPNWQTAAAAFTIGASLTTLINSINKGDLFGVTVSYYGLAAGGLNLAGSYYQQEPRIADPIEAIIRGIGESMGVSEPKINLVNMMAYGGVMALAAEFDTKLKRVVFTLAVLAAAKAGFEFGASIGKSGGWE